MKKIIVIMMLLIIGTISNAAQHIRVYDTKKGLFGNSYEVNIYHYLQKVLQEFPKERIIFWSVDGLQRSNDKFPSKITILTEDIK